MDDPCQRGCGERDALLLGHGGEITEAAPVVKQRGGHARRLVGCQRASPPRAAIVTQPPLSSMGAIQMMPRDVGVAYVGVAYVGVAAAVG